MLLDARRQLAVDCLQLQMRRLIRQEAQRRLVSAEAVPA